MAQKSLIQKAAGFPIPLLPTLVGAVTLSNVYAGQFQLTWIRHISTVASMVVWLFALIKITVHFKVFKNEYKNTVPASLTAGFTMLMMLFGAYLLPYNAAVGKAIWFAGVGLHAIHILIFTFMNVLRGVKLDTFVPSWFVTYNGFLVSAVVGVPMKEPFILTCIVYYGLGVYAILGISMLIRVASKPINPPLLHTKAIFLAPAALCLVGYLNIIKFDNVTGIPIIVYILYGAVFLSFLYFLKNLPAFFAVPFAPGFAGMTFPNAIGIVASYNMSGYLKDAGYEQLSSIVKQIAGIQLYITTAVIALVVFNFIKMFKKSYEKKEEAAK
ncbi:MAG: TDT family transporter [Treponema sp.]|nr:TDT family transporter [Treponema sp.]